MTKHEAREETLRRWRALPEAERATYEDADAFATTLSTQLRFHTMGDIRNLILSWILRDMDGLPPWGHIDPEQK